MSVSAAAPGRTATEPTGLREGWMLAEMASELALFLWRTAPAASERAAAHREYLAALSDEEYLASQLAGARP